MTEKKTIISMSIERAHVARDILNRLHDFRFKERLLDNTAALEDGSAEFECVHTYNDFTRVLGFIRLPKRDTRLTKMYLLLGEKTRESREKTLEVYRAIKSYAQSKGLPFSGYTEDEKFLPQSLLDRTD